MKPAVFFSSLRCRRQRLAKLLEMRPLNTYVGKREKELKALNLLVWQLLLFQTCQNSSQKKQKKKAVTAGDSKMAL